MKMVERMARALCASDMDTAEGGLVDKFYHLYLDEALAALKAMREPSDSMVSAAHDAHKAAGLLSSQCAANTIYGAMIDVAVAEAEAE